MNHYQQINQLLDELEDTMGVIKIKEEDEYLADQVMMAQTMFCMGLLIAVLGAAVLLIAGHFDQLGLGVGTGMIIAGVVCVTLGIGLGVHVKRVEKRTMRVKGNVIGIATEDVTKGDLVSIKLPRVKTGVHEGQWVGGENE